jgi:hypothetical protein
VTLCFIIPPLAFFFGFKSRALALDFVALVVFFMATFLCGLWSCRPAQQTVVVDGWILFLGI